MIKIILFASRWLQFASCLLPCGCWVLDRFMAGPLAANSSASRAWLSVMRRLMAASMIAAIVSGFGWLAAVSISISGLPPTQALRPAVLSLVWHHTHFGHVWQARLWIGLALGGTATAALLLEQRLRGVFAWPTMLLAFALAGSLAWAGHGITGDTPLERRWHLTADVLHLLVAGVWPLGLLPFMLILRTLRGADYPDKWHLMAAVTARFSTISIAAFGLLLGSGIADSIALVQSWHGLFHTSYGQLLLVKIALFGVMVAIGAVNLTRLRGRLTVAARCGDGRDSAAASKLQRNVIVELALATAVLAIVAVLGTMAPPMPPM